MILKSKAPLYKTGELCFLRGVALRRGNLHEKEAVLTVLGAAPFPVEYNKIISPKCEFVMNSFLNLH